MVFVFHFVCCTLTCRDNILLPQCLPLSLSVILFLGGYLFVDMLIELVTTLGRAGRDDVSALHWPRTCVTALSVLLMNCWWCVCVCVCMFASGSKINFLPELPTADEWTKLSGHYTLDFYLKLEPFSFSTFFYALNFFLYNFEHAIYF